MKSRLPCWQLEAGPVSEVCSGNLGHLLLIDQSEAVGRQWASVQPSPRAATLVTPGLLPGRLGSSP